MSCHAGRDKDPIHFDTNVFACWIPWNIEHRMWVKGGCGKALKFQPSTLSQDWECHTPKNRMLAVRQRLDVEARKWIPKCEFEFHFKVERILLPVQHGFAGCFRFFWNEWTNDSGLQHKSIRLEWIDGKMSWMCEIKCQRRFSGAGAWRKASMQKRNCGNYSE